MDAVVAGVGERSAGDDEQGLWRAGDAVGQLQERRGGMVGAGLAELHLHAHPVAVEGLKDGSEIEVQVTSVLTTANGRLVFARPTPATAREH